MSNQYLENAELSAAVGKFCTFRETKSLRGDCQLQFGSNPAPAQRFCRGKSLIFDILQGSNKDLRIGLYNYMDVRVTFFAEPSNGSRGTKKGPQ